MGRMWPVAIKNEVDICCGFIGAPRARAVWVRKWRSDVVRVRSGSTRSPNRNATRKVTSANCHFGYCGVGEQEESESESVFVSLTRNRWVRHQSGSGFWQELFDGLVSAVVLTDFYRAGEMEFHSGFDLACRDVVTARFQTLRQFFRAAEHAHRLAVHVHLQEQRLALAGLHAIDLGDDRRNRAFLGGSRNATRLDRRCCCRARWFELPRDVV